MLSHRAAFTGARDWLDELVAGLDSNRALLGELIEEHLPQVRWIPPQGTYLAWLDCRALDAAPAAPKDTFAVATDIGGPAKIFFDGGVAVNSGHIFGIGGDGHVRLNFATSHSILRGAFDAMGRAVSGSRSYKVR